MAYNISNVKCRGSKPGETRLFLCGFVGPDVAIRVRHLGATNPDFMAWARSHSGTPEMEALQSLTKWAELTEIERDAARAVHRDLVAQYAVIDLSGFYEDSEERDEDGDPLPDYSKPVMPTPEGKAAVIAALPYLVFDELMGFVIIESNFTPKKKPQLSAEEIAKK